MSDYLMDASLWLIGAGNMGMEYAKVLLGQRRPFDAIGRGPVSAARFHEKIGVRVTEGGVEGALAAGLSIPRFAIVAVNVEQLFHVTGRLLRLGVRDILVEKPAGLNTGQVAALNALAVEKSARVCVAYNRRFYASVRKAREMIEADGGVTSFDFEFTERPHKIDTRELPREVLANWFLANSSHVVDLAFYLGGRPRRLACFSTGELSWYKKAAVFSGAGVTENGALFSYRANWAGAGRWGLAIYTAKNTFILRPLEKLQILNKGNADIYEYPLDDTLDAAYKPGLYLETEAFLTGQTEKLLTLGAHCGNMKIYDAIEAGKYADLTDC